MYLQSPYVGMHAPESFDGGAGGGGSPRIHRHRSRWRPESAHHPGGPRTQRDSKSRDVPPRADGVYLPEGGPPLRWTRGTHVDLHLMIFGDSTATGYGCRSADEVPGVRIARGLAQESGKRIRLSTKSIGRHIQGFGGSGRRHVRRGFATRRGSNHGRRERRHGCQRNRPSARRLRSGCASALLQWSGRRRGHVSGLRVDQRHPSTTAVGGTRTRTPTFARAQAAAVRAAGGLAVPMADLLAPNFLEDPEEMFSDDGYHPSAAGYELAAKINSPGALPRPRRVDRSDSSRTAVGYSVGRQIQGRPTGPVTRLLRRRPDHRGACAPGHAVGLGSQERRGSVPDARAPCANPLGAVMPEAVIVSARSPSDGP